MSGNEMHLTFFNSSHSKGTLACKYPESSPPNVNYSCGTGSGAATAAQVCPHIGEGERPSTPLTAMNRIPD